MKKKIRPINFNFRPTLLQDKAMEVLMDKETKVVLFGGSAGCGKSYLACCYLIMMCVQYAGVVGGLTRSRIIDLERSTLITLFQVFKEFDIEEGEHFKFDRSNNIITFFNGSKIMLFDSKFYPHDPEFERLSSTEFTFVVIDEASQITKKAFEIIQTRIRYKHDHYNLIPKTLVVTNPTTNFIKSDIYEPYIKGELPITTKVVLGKVQDNKHVSQSYIDNLLTLSGAIKSRLLHGDWNYVTSDDSIFDPEKLNNIFYNHNYIHLNKDRYLTCDVASSGSDLTCITIWEGLKCFKIETLKHKTIPQIYERIRYLMNEYKVSISKVIVDKTGVGTGLVDMLKGCVGFIANQKPKNQIYGMLKDELYYKLGEYINNDKILIAVENYKDELIQELQAHKMYNYDKDNTKTQVLPKEKVKQIIGRSPDISDAIMLRMYFESITSGFSFSFT